jgi:hypothetical protein
VICRFRHRYESVELTEFRLALDVSCDNEVVLPCERRLAELDAVSSCCLVCLCINLNNVRRREKRSKIEILTWHTLTWHCLSDLDHTGCNFGRTTLLDRYIRERMGLIVEERQIPWYKYI